jgi:hypothetical protein
VSLCADTVETSLTTEAVAVILASITRTLDFGGLKLPAITTEENKDKAERQSGEWSRTWTVTRQATRPVLRNINVDVSSRIQVVCFSELTRKDFALAGRK